MKRGKSVFFLPLLLGLGVFLRRAHAERNLYTLNEVASFDSAYFYNASDKAMLVRFLAESYTANITNVIVAVQGDSIQSLVDEWQDSQGRFHSISILKKQLEFNDYFKEAFKKRTGETYSNSTGLEDCPDGSVNYSHDLWFDGLHHCYPIARIDVTGIGGRDLMFVPYYRAIIRFTVDYDRFMRECKEAADHECTDGKPWPNAYFGVLDDDLDLAGSKMEVLYAALLSIPIINEKSTDETSVQAVFYPDRGLAISFDFAGRDNNLNLESLSGYRYAITDDDMYGHFDDYEVDSTAIRDDLLARIQQAASEVNDALTQEEATADGIFGPEHSQ